MEESKEKCAEVCNDLVSAACFYEDFSLHSLQVKVICESREDWWNALLAWLRSLGGSKGICDFFKHHLDSTNYLIHLVQCNFSSNPNPSECSNTFVANQLAWLKEQDGVNTEELNFATKCLLAIVVTIGLLILFALILTLLLGRPQYQGEGGSGNEDYPYKEGFPYKQDKKQEVDASQEDSLQVFQAQFFS